MTSLFWELTNKEQGRGLRMYWGKTGTRGEICRNLISHFFPCFYWEFKRKREFLEISANFSSCTVFTLRFRSFLMFQLEVKMIKFLKIKFFFLKIKFYILLTFLILVIVINISGRIVKTKSKTINIRKRQRVLRLRYSHRYSSHRYSYRHSSCT